MGVDQEAGLEGLLAGEEFDEQAGLEGPLGPPAGEECDEQAEEA